MEQVSNMIQQSVRQKISFKKHILPKKTKLLIKFEVFVLAEPQEHITGLATITQLQQKLKASSDSTSQYVFDHMHMKCIYVTEIKIFKA
jgi:hypothetical protein